MKRKTDSGINDRMGLWLILLVILGTGGVFLWTSSNFQHNEPGMETFVDQQGDLHVLGITLGETTLKQAEFILKSKSDVALYIYPQGHPRAGMKLEAFFPAITDHTKVILLLDLSKETLRDIESRATIPHLYPNDVARMNLAASDMGIIHRAVVRQLTLIPNLSLGAAALKARFGEPTSSSEASDGEQRLNFPNIGLKAVVNKEAPPRLEFSNPLREN